MTQEKESREAFGKWFIEYHGYKPSISMNEHHNMEWAAWQACEGRHPDLDDPKVVEEVARAICSSEGFDPNADPHGPYCSWRDSIDQAQAAIAAIKKMGEK